MAGTLIAADPDNLTSERLADARHWGIDPTLVATTLEPAFSVWAGNADTVLAFLAASTQWRTALQPGESGWRTVWIGLDYAAAKVAIEAHGLQMSPLIWGGLVTMERAAAAALNGEPDHQ